MPLLHADTPIDAPARHVFDWYLKPGAFERLIPPWLRLRVLERSGKLANNSLVMRVQLPIAGPFLSELLVRHAGFKAGSSFRDWQERGPFAQWIHTHAVRSTGRGKALVCDTIEYDLPGGFAGRLVDHAILQRRLQALLAYRQRTMADDIQRHRAFGTKTSLRIAISGATGMLGRALTTYLTTAGHTVIPVTTRRHPLHLLSDDTAGVAEPVHWSPARGELPSEPLEGIDAFIHLAGENIAQRWTAERMADIRSSRVDGTRLVARTLAKLERPPAVLVCASASGFYGDRGESELDESAGPGAGFLASVVRGWEQAADAAREAGIRTVHTRFGLILSPSGGLLARLLPLFRLGLGGPSGNGRQLMSWISLDDAVSAIELALSDSTMNGPVNVCSPHVVRNSEFAMLLADSVARPDVMRVPTWVLRPALGKMADELLLASTSMRPDVLTRAGYRFRDPTLRDALTRLLGKTRIGEFGLGHVDS